MKPLKIAFFTATFLAGFHASAWDVRTDVRENRDFLSLSGDMSQFTLEGGSITGSGAKIDFLHYFGERASVDVFLTSAVNASQSGAASFTGYGAHINYAAFQDCCTQKRTVEVNGRALVTENAETRSLFEVGVGLNQYLLNGSKGVYSASGLDAALSYRFTLLSFQWKAQARYGQLTAAAVPVQATFFSLGMTFPL